MRIRSIKPDYWQHEMHGRISETAAILGAAMLNYADDDGRFKVQFSALRSLLFTHRKKTDEEIEHAYRELEQERFVITYQATLDGRTTTLCQIATFRRHQSINKPVPSRLPGPSPEWQTPPLIDEKNIPKTPLPESSRSVPVVLPESSRSVPSTSNSSTPDDSRTTPVGRKEGEEWKERKERDARDPQFQEPTLEAVRTFGDMHGIGPECCEKFFYKAKETGWLGKNGPIVDWQSSLQAYAVTWRSNEYTKKMASSKTFEDGRPGGASLPGSVGAAIDRRARKTALAQLIADHPANEESNSYNEDCTTEDRKDLTRLRIELETLTREMAA